ncbi:MAG TPA: alpha/beta fold hydrolase [Solirubrobacter sp.]
MLNPFVMTKLMVNARRAPLTRSPADVGLEFESVSFPAADGVGLKGWFIPSGADEPSPAVVFVHGWMWNRHGNIAHQVKGLKDADVDFLPAAKGLHDAGFNVLLFDVRWHGESERGPKPLSYGPVEAQDYIGAVRYLRTRPEVDGERIGAIGTSMGGNIVLYGTPEAQPIKAILAIQPTRLAVFNHNFMRTEMGPLGPPMTKPMELVYAALRTPRPGKHDPAVPARKLGDTVVQYVQGTGDPWGRMEIVEEFASVTPKSAGPVIKFPSTGRYEGYAYISERADDVVAFFREHL